MRVVDREARRLQRLWSALRDLFRLQAGQVPMQREPLDLAVTSQPELTTFRSGCRPASAAVTTP